MQLGVGKMMLSGKKYRMKQLSLKSWKLASGKALTLTFWKVRRENMKSFRRKKCSPWRKSCTGLQHSIPYISSPRTLCKSINWDFLFLKYSRIRIFFYKYYHISEYWKLNWEYKYWTFVGFIMLLVWEIDRLHFCAW